MPKDFKNNPPPRDNARAGHPLLLGMIIGLLMGIVIALSVALWLNRLSNPFVDKAKSFEPLAKIGPAQPPKPDEKGAAAKGAADKAPAEKPKTDRPRFEFYTMLPGEKEVTDKEAKAAVAKPKEPAKSGPGSSPSQPKPHSGEVFWLQAGAFAEEKDADNLKAKIAFTGLEASVRPVEVPGKGTLHRVRLGPYQSLEDANRFKTALSQNGVDATIIRTDEAKNR
ncbi:MAG TPA: SPOR domain-containing protein [Usitatibacteraceae bacterium]|nr:SPOR domain-containing protein [Usitatibacteraceae bacterium]